MKKILLFGLSAAVFFVLFLGGSGCSSKETVKNSKENISNSLAFYSEEDGGKYYEVSFDKKNRIASLYIDGKEIPESDYDKHRDIIDEKLDDLRGDRLLRDYTFNVNVPKAPPLPEVWDDDSGSHHRMHVYKFFNDSSFNGQMADVRKELMKLKDMKIRMNFDNDEFKKSMEEFRYQMKDMKLDEKLKDLNKDIRAMTEKMKEKQYELDDIDVDIPDISIEIKNLDKKLEGLDKEMGNLKTELTKLDHFMDDVRKELYKDGIIQSEDEDFSMDLNADGMRINDKEIPADKFLKYKELYKKHFGKELKEDQKIEIRK